MCGQKINFKTEKELQEAIIQEKSKGTPDIEIGQKYGVTFRYIERLITKSQGVNISAFDLFFILLDKIIYFSENIFGYNCIQEA